VDPLKILLFAANPFGDLKLDEEIRRIEGKLDDADLRKIQLVAVPGTRPGDLIDKIDQHSPQVVQFSGHGIGGKGSAAQGAPGSRDAWRDLMGPAAADEGKILVIGEDGRPKAVGIRGLVSLFRQHSNLVKIVVLNACSTSSQAEAIAEHIDCVIGTSRSISDEAARIFAARLYHSLAKGRSIATAFDTARIELELQGFEEQAGIPKLWTKKGVDPSRVYLVPGDDERPKPRREPARSEPPAPAPVALARKVKEPHPAPQPVAAPPPAPKITLHIDAEPPAPPPKRFPMWAWPLLALSILGLAGYALWRRPIDDPEAWRWARSMVTPVEKTSVKPGSQGTDPTPGAGSSIQEPTPEQAKEPPKLDSAAIIPVPTPAEREPRAPSPPVTKSANTSARLSTAECEALAAGLRRLYDSTRAVRSNAMRMAIVLNEHLSAADLLGLISPATEAGAAPVSVVAPPGKTAGVIKLRRCTLSLENTKIELVSDLRKTLDRKDIGLVVFVDPLKSEQTHDEITGKIQPSLGVLLRNLQWSLEAGKDVYVSSSEQDAVTWRRAPPSKPPTFRTDEEFDAFMRYSLEPMGKWPLEEAFKGKRVTSYGGKNWEDLAEFLTCVKSRSEPAHSFWYLPPAPN
jgi:hypothetical protein